MSLTARDLRGIFPALTTSFDADGRYDPSGMVSHVEWMYEAGMTGVVPLGGTGEYTALSPAERLQVVETCVTASNAKGPVIAGVLSPGYEEAVETGKAFAGAGADALMLVTPFYVLSGQQGIIEYYRRFHKEVGLPILLYEIPSRTNVSYEPETVKQLAEDGIAIGIKYSNLDVVKFTRVIIAAGELMTVMGGDDSLLAAHMALGATGSILATANLCPEAWVKCFRLAQSGDLAAATALQKKLYPMIEAVFSEPNPTALKHAMKMIGRDAGPVRVPLTGVSPSTEAWLEQLIASHPELSSGIW